MLVAWRAKDRAIVVIVGPHDASDADVYGQLLASLGITAPDEDREKPPCCDEEGDPPADAGVASDPAFPGGLGD